MEQRNEPSTAEIVELLRIGLVSGLIDIAKDKRKKRKEGNA